MTSTHRQHDPNEALAVRDGAHSDITLDSDKLPHSNRLAVAHALYETVVGGVAKAQKTRPARALKKLQNLCMSLRNADAFLFETYAHPDAETDSHHRAIATLHHQAYSALVAGYVHVFDAAWRKNKSSVALEAATLALNCLKNAVLVNFLANDHAPESQWLHAHHFFRHIASAPLEWTRKRSDQVETVINLYKHIMLLGIAQPHFLTPQEILVLDRELKVLAPHAHIVPAQMEWERQHAFLIHTTLDTVPRRYSPSHNFGDSQLWLLDTRDVVARFRLSQLAHESATASRAHTAAASHLAPTKVEQLARAWQAGERRTAVRQRSPMRLWLTTGLVHTFDALCAATRSELLGSAARDEPHAATRRAAIWQAAKPHIVTLHSHSAGGLSMFWQDDGAEPLPQVGDLMGVFTGDASGLGKLLALGSLTWLRPRNRDGWACGMQLLAESAVPLALETQPNGMTQPCLLLPQRKPQNARPRLVTLPDNTAGRIITLNDGRYVQAIKLDQRITSQPHFSCFGFAPHAASAPPHATETAAPPSNVTPIKRRPGQHPALVVA